MSQILTPIQSTSFLQFEPFPSEPQNHYKSVRGEVFVEVTEDPDDVAYDVDVQAAFSVAGAGTVGSVRVDTCVTINEATGRLLYPEEAEHVARAIADLEHMNKEWNAFYLAASTALGDLASRAE